MNLVLRLAWRNLWRQPRRTWLTTGAMIFSNVLLIFLVSMQVGMYRHMVDNALKAFTGHMQVQAPGYKDDQKMRQVVPEVNELATSMRQTFDSDTIAARASTFVLASSEDRSYGIAIFGVEPAFEPNVSSLPGLIDKGRFLLPGDVSGIVIGKILARNLRVGLGDELTLLGSGRDGSFAAAVLTIVGIFDSGVTDIDRSIAEVSLDTFQDIFYMDGAGHQVVVNASSVEEAERLQPRVENLIGDDSSLIVHDWDALQPGLKQAIRADMGTAFFTYAILVVLVAFSVLNTQLMSVLERTREFGIALSLGLTPGRLGRLVLLETTLMGAMGLFFGVVVGGALTYWIGIYGFTMPGMDEMAAKFNMPSRIYPQVNAISLLAGPAFVFLFSLLATLYPALRLHRLHPVEAMRAV